MFVLRFATISLVGWLVPAAMFLSPLHGAAQKSESKKSQPKKIQSKTSAAKKSATAHPRNAASKGTRAKPVAASSKTAAGKRGQVRTTARSSQRQPSQERYQEIQQALSEKGYYQGSASGAWGPESVDALKKFQRDEKLPEDGKLSSKSIIALGLGPRRTAAAPKEQQ